METITVSLELFEKLTNGADCLAKGYHLNEEQRDAWRAIRDEAEAAQRAAKQLGNEG